MGRLSDHCFTMPEAPVFGWEDAFYDPEPAGRAAERVPPERESHAAVSPFGGSAPVTINQGAIK